MRYLRLFVISAIVFGIILFLMSLLFPSSTYVSRALNVHGQKDSLQQRLPSLFDRSFRQLDPKASLLESPSADTLLFQMQGMNGGMALYPASGDSTTLQVYYHIRIPWYRPWDKFGLMINETKYGPSLDTALALIGRATF